MTHVICRLTAKNRDQLRNPTLGSRVRATFTFISRDLTTRGQMGTGGGIMSGDEEGVSPWLTLSVSESATFDTLSDNTSPRPTRANVLIARQITAHTTIQRIVAAAGRISDVEFTHTISIPERGTTPF